MHPATLHGVGVITDLESRSEVIQGHRFWYVQSKANTGIHIPNSGHSNLDPILQRFRDTAA